MTPAQTGALVFIVGFLVLMVYAIYQVFREYWPRRFVGCVQCGKRRSGTGFYCDRCERRRDSRFKRHKDQRVK